MGKKKVSASSSKYDEHFEKGRVPDANRPLSITSIERARLAEESDRRRFGIQHIFEKWDEEEKKEKGKEA